MKRVPQVSIILTLLLVGTAFFTQIAFSSQGKNLLADETPASPSSQTAAGQVFFPIVAGRGVAISGRVTDINNAPVAGVTITDNSGKNATTGSDGNYILNGLSSGEHALAPSASGYVFSPSVASINVPPGVNQQDFTAIAACTNVITNSSFEDNSGWELPVTERTARYSTANFHTGVRSALTGILSSETNKYSYSSVRQLVNIPSDASSATLRVWLYPRSEEETTAALPPVQTGLTFGENVLAGDVQYVLVLDKNNNILQTLLWIRSDSQEWMLHEFNLAVYAGEQIKIHIGTYNDGAGGKTAMYVDDVTLELCPDSEPTATPVPTTTGTPPACVNELNNSGFEATSDWEIPNTVFDAAYVTSQAHAGARSMRTGIEKTADNVFSYSDAGQWVTIPKNSISATLKLWVYPVTEESTALAVPKPSLTSDFRLQSPANDVQYLLILDQFEQIIDIPLWQLSNDQNWVYHEFNLTGFAGQTVKIQFGSFNTGGGQGVTAMYVDDITLDACPSGAPTATPTITPTPTVTPTPTATPTPTLTPTLGPSPTSTPTPPGGATPTATATPSICDDGIDNGGFEQTSDWIIPITEFSAGYSTSQAHAGSRSMRTGIIYTVHNRFSYSDAAQVVTIPASSDDVLLRMWIYPLSEESMSLALPAIPQSTIFGKEALSNDVQYVIVLDRFDNWIDTLLWQRSDSQKWDLHTFDLSNYSGEMIKIQFGTYNDGLGGVTAMYVDDVSLQICP
jgi:hypothetical protein